MAAAANTAKYGKGLLGLWKRGWHEIPDVMAANIAGLFGIVGLLYIAWDARDGHRDVKRYRYHYTVMRPDDPRLEKIKNPN